MSRKVSASLQNHLAVVGTDFYAVKVVTWEKPTKDGKCTERTIENTEQHFSVGVL